MATDIDLLYVKMTRQLNKDNIVAMLTYQLLSTKKNGERVKLVYELLDKYKMFPDYIEVTKKCDISEKYREDGNEAFKNREDGKAFKMYNQALINAPNGSKQLCLAYSNRSATNCSLKNYSDCLKDIHRVLELDCDEKLKTKLLKRKTFCEKMISENPVTDEIDIQCKGKFRLSKPKHNEIPAACSSLKINYSNAMGRCVTAVSDISPGEVLVLEEPYCCILLEPFFLEFCYYCLKQCDSLIPCDKCCYAMFCGEECKQNAYKNFHRIDCKLMPLLSAMKFTKLELIALRTVLQAKCTHDNCDALIKVISEAESVTDPLLKGFTIDPLSGEKIFDSKDYKTIHTLETNIDKRNPSELFQKCVTVGIFLDFLFKYTEFFNGCEIDESKNIFENKCVAFYGGLLLHHSMTAPSNMHTISVTIPTVEMGYTEGVGFGSGAFGFLSILNHSCTPNVVRENIGSNIALVALRSLKPGDQLFDNYGFHFAVKKREERLTGLNHQYKFICQCEACINNWPKYLDLPNANKRTVKILSRDLLTQKLFDDLKNGDRSVALDVIDQLYPYITALEKTAPNKDLANYEETLKQCWALFGNVVPFR